LAASLECLFGLDGEANGDFARAVENLEEMIAEQATKLASVPTLETNSIRR
jgi:hypothetical protein